MKLLNKGAFKMIEFEWIKMDKHGCYTVSFNADGKQKALFFQTIGELMDFVGVNPLFCGGKLPDNKDMTDKSGTLLDDNCINYAIKWIKSNIDNLQPLLS